MVEDAKQKEARIAKMKAKMAQYSRYELWKAACFRGTKDAEYKKLYEEATK